MSVRKLIIGSALAVTASTAAAWGDPVAANTVLPGCKDLLGEGFGDTL